MSRKNIIINFLGYGRRFNKNDNWITRILSERYHVTVSDQADYCFVGSFLPQKYYKKLRGTISIFFPSEAISPDFNIYDYAIGFDDLKLGDRYHRYLPVAQTLARGSLMDEPKDPFHRKFCNFIYGNPEAHSFRDEFFWRLSEYKKVDSLGMHLKNVDDCIEPRGGDWYRGSIAAKSNYKFSLSFENAIYRGYTSEKIISSFQAGSIPIYWGNPEIYNDVSPGSFINCHDYESVDDLVAAIIELDTDKSKYMEMLNAPKGEMMSATFIDAHTRSLEQFLFGIFDQDYERAKRKPEGYWPYRYMKGFSMVNQLFVENRLIEKIARLYKS